MTCEFYFLSFFFFNPYPRICLLILEREGGRETDRHQYERNFDWLPPICTQTGDQTCNLSMYPDQESNLQSFAVWDDTPTN